MEEIWLVIVKLGVQEDEKKSQKLKFLSNRRLKKNLCLYFLMKVRQLLVRFVIGLERILRNIKRRNFNESSIFI